VPDVLFFDVPQVSVLYETTLSNSSQSEW
jgi:hypothetical protein